MDTCYRCESELVNVTPNDVSDIIFYECSGCKCHYAKTSNSQLHDRWLMPITLPLYGVIYEENPLSRAKSEAQAFVERDNIDLEILKKHIKDELENPKQNISEIHDFVYPDERKLREFLKVFVDELESLQNSI